MNTNHQMATINTTTTITKHLNHDQIGQLQQFHGVAVAENRTKLGNFMNKFFRNLFYLQFLLINILIIGLIIRGLVFKLNRRDDFNPKKWYLPLLASSGASAVAGFAWQMFTSMKPVKSVKAVFWISPLLTCGAGVVLVAIGTGGGLAAGVISVVFAVVQSLYACWVSRRFEYATLVVAAAVAVKPGGGGATQVIMLSVIGSFVYSCFVIAGIGGATATGDGLLDTIFIVTMVLSLTWTMHVIKNVLLVAASKVKHLQFINGSHLSLNSAFNDTVRQLMGSVCLGSVVVPVVGIIRGSARAVNIVEGDTDEFLFSCASCYSGVASRLTLYGNRWGFVQVGAYNKWFVQASLDTWESFTAARMEALIDSDLTSSFCFLSGVTGGALSVVVGGSWALVVLKDHATEISLYSFLIGYLTSRVAMVWPQACVAAYYVAYAENPQRGNSDSTIPDRIQELQRYRHGALRMITRLSNIQFAYKPEAAEGQSWLSTFPLGLTSSVV